MVNARMFTPQRAFEEAARGPLGDRAGSGVDARHCGLARLAPMILESDERHVWFRFLFRNMQRPKARIWRHRFRWFRLPWGESAPEPQSGARRLAYAQAGYAARRETPNSAPRRATRRRLRSIRRPP